MADKRISQLIERVDIANNDVLPIVASGAITTNKVTISSIQTYMQENLDVGVTSVGITIGTSGTDVNVTGSPVTTSGNITINIPTASATNRGLLSAADWTTFNNKADAGNYVTLDTAQTITGSKTFNRSGNTDTLIINHTSGSGRGINITKDGNGEALRIHKGSGSGNAVYITGGSLEAQGGIFNAGVTLTAVGTANPTIIRNTSGTTSSTTGSNVIGFNGTNNIFVTTESRGGFILGFNNSVSNREYTLPDASGTIALTSNLGAYLPLTGGTLTGALNGTSASFSSNSGIIVGANSRAFIRQTIGGDAEIGAPSGGTLSLINNGSASLSFSSTGAATFSSSVGIGVSPSAGKLHILAPSSVSYAPVIAIRDEGNPTFGFSFKLDTAVNGDLRLDAVNNSVDTPLMTFKRVTGNVGIGTASPQTKLQINQGTDLNVGFNTTSVDSVTTSRITSYNDAFNLSLGLAINGEPLVLQTGGTERMRITSGGQVQIGGTSHTFIDYTTNTARFFGGGSTNTFGLGAASTIYYQGDNAQFYPTADNGRSLGVAGARFSAVWAVNGTIQTSDEREKKDIIDSDLGLDFVNKLRPVSFKWKVGQNMVTTEVLKDEEGNLILDEEGKEKTESVINPREGVRTHYGLIAQEVEELLDGKDFGGFIHDKETDIKGLRYDQFVPLLIKAIQELKAEIDSLKN